VNSSELPVTEEPGAMNPSLEAVHPPEYLPIVEYRPRLVIPIVLFFLTLVSTTISGSLYQDSFLQQQHAATGQNPSSGVSLITGFSYAFAVVGILLAHELGHYLACRYYGIAATLPYFIPFPLLSYAGTMGAFIRIRSIFRNRRQLFDVGVAGPLAGYIFALPALYIGMRASHVIPIDTNTEGMVSFGEPLIFKLVAHFFFDYSEATHTINLHPVGWAAWFGIFATSINLFPAGQLDGGHIVYALFGKAWHKRVSIAVCIGLALISLVTWSPAYLFFASLVFFLGLRHPQLLTEEDRLDRRRIWIALIAAVILIISFIPVPITIQE
jgi:membrane-associated protease RseP (regulator of RpoE activity)